MRLLLVLALLAAALAVPVAVIATRGGGSEPDFRGSPPPANLSLPNFSLRDDEGRTVSSQQLRGKALAVTFLDAQCTDACPLVAAQVAQGVRTLGSERGQVEAIGISVDPVRDTPPRIATFLRRFRATGTIRYLDGTVAELEPLWRAFAVRASFETDGNIHSAPVMIYDGQSRWRSTLQPGRDLTAANVAHDLHEALKAS